MAGIAQRKCMNVLALVILCGPFSLAQARPENPRTVFEHGQNALSSGQYAVAEQDFQKLLRQGVQSASIYTNLGVVYLRTNRLDAAVASLSKAQRLSPKTAGIHLNLGLAFLRKQEFKRAAAQFAAVISIDPSNLQARYLKGVCHFMTDDFSPALAAFEPIFDREQVDIEYLYMLGISYGVLKRPGDAQRIFDLLVTAGGETPHLHLLLGKAYMALNQNQKAEAELQQAATGTPLPYAHYYLGELYRRIGKPDQAASQYEKEIEADSGNPWAFKELAVIKLLRGDTGGAISLLQTGSGHNPDTAELFAILGRAYARVPDLPRATAAFKRAVALDSGNSSYYFQLGRVLVRAGRPREAKEALARARTLNSAEHQGQMRALSLEQTDLSAKSH